MGILGGRRSKKKVFQALGHIFKSMNERFAKRRNEGKVFPEWSIQNGRAYGNIWRLENPLPNKHLCGFPNSPPKKVLFVGN